MNQEYMLLLRVLETMMQIRKTVPNYRESLYFILATTDAVIIKAEMRQPKYLQRFLLRLIKR